LLYESLFNGDIFDPSQRLISPRSLPMVLALAWHMTISMLLNLHRSAPGARHLEAMVAFRRET